MQSLLDRITYHAVYDDTIVDALGYAHEHRFAGIQVGVETPHLSFARQSAADCRAIARLRERQ